MVVVWDKYGREWYGESNSFQKMKILFQIIESKIIKKYDVDDVDALSKVEGRA